MSDEANRSQNTSGKKIPWKAVVLLAVVVGIMAVSPFLGLPEKIGQLKGWIDGAGALGPVVFVCIYIVAVILALPGSAMSVVAGVLFGAFWGTILVINAATIGAALAFLIARYIARDAISTWLADKKQFQKLGRLTERQGAVIVAITRLVPFFPFNILNYGFGLTRVRFWTYAGWTWLCMLPGTVLYVSGAGGIAEAVEQRRVPWVHVGVVIFILVLLAIIVPRARQKLKEDKGD